MKEEDIVGFDGNRFFCKSCGRTSPSKMGVLGHQRSCPNRSLKNIQKYNISEVAKQWANSQSQKQQSSNQAFQALGNYAGGVEHRVERVEHRPEHHQQEPVYQQNQEPQQEYNPLTVNTPGEFMQIAQVLPRVYGLEQNTCQLQQSIAYIEQSLQRIEQHTFNDQSHIAAVQSQSPSPWLGVLKNVAGVAVVAFFAGWALGSRNNSTENPVKKVANNVLETGAKRIVAKLI